MKLDMIAKSDKAGFVLTFLLISFLYATPLSAQTRETSTFTGRVTDAKTGEPISNVNVFVAGSTSGSSTDELGNYSFQTQLTGNHYIVFSIIGYKTQSKFLEISTGESYVINLQLEPVTIQLQEVEVVSTNKEWKQNFEYFQRQFVGETEFAKETKIINPWVLDFKKENNMLTATANQPIIVTNQALGYQIQIELIQFEWNINTDLGIYKVYSLYEKLNPNNEEQEKRWLKNRIETFHGSQAHFFRSLYRDNWQENNYSISDSGKLYPLTDDDLKYYFLTAQSTIRKQPQGWKAFRLEDIVNIYYNNKLTYQLGSVVKTVRMNKVAGIKSNREDSIFLVNRWGLLKDVASVHLYGLWGRSRIANSLPNNYTFKPKY